VPMAKKANSATSSAPIKKAAAATAAAPLTAAKAAPAKAASAKSVPVKSAPVAVAAAPKAVAAEKPAKVEKHRKKLVRDSFTMPADDFALIAMLKERALDGKRPAKKSELLRAGLRALIGLKATELAAALNALAPVKAGRPTKA